ncbi:hypothetical protein [Rhodanobacter sp. B05]|uniref:hypothetical protein n=1 Tax=Rhodanobacter sp. B05 TaxID=1945859 RepID=UPI0011156E2C|nr:hypothetical protein [Rhodanobacter sp. B05]
MRDLTQIAESATAALKMKLQGSLFAGEQTALRCHASTGQGGATIKDVLNQYEKALRDLSALYVDKYRWISTQALIANWVHSVTPALMRRCFPRWRPSSSLALMAKSDLRSLYEFCEARLRNVLPNTGITNPSMFDAYVNILAGIYTDVQEGMLLSFDEASAEIERSMIRKGLGPLQKLSWLVTGAAIGALTTGYFRK